MARNRLEPQIAAAGVSSEAAQEMRASADARVARAQADYDLTRGGIYDLEKKLEADIPDTERELLEDRLNFARAERARLLQAHSQTHKWTNNDWATPGVQAQIAVIESVQGDDPAERALLDGQIVTCHEVRAGSNTITQWVLDNGVIGYHKIFSGLDDDLAEDFGQDEAVQPIHEVAAWHLAKGMGEPWRGLVPPCVLREIDGEQGSFAAKAPGANYQDFRATDNWQAAAFFDALIGQQDRHGGNWLVDSRMLTLIDHGFTFACPGDYCNKADIQSARKHDPLSEEERAVLERLVASPDLLGVRHMLAPDRADALLARAQQMLDTGEIPKAGPY